MENIRFNQSFSTSGVTKVNIDTESRFNIKMNESSSSLARIVSLFILFTFFLTGANVTAFAGTSQEKTISLNLKNVTLKNAIEAVKKQTDYSFFIDAKDVDLNKTITINVNKKSIKEVLDVLFKGQPIQYEIKDKHIIIGSLVDTQREENTGNSKKVTGIVNDELSEPVIGANITVKGTTNGTITDVNGQFSLDVHPNDVLLISYIGYITQEVPVRGNNFFTIHISEDTQSLEEVVVIGYGTTTRKEFTGSVTSMKLEDSPIALASNTNALESLKGNVSGLDIGATNTAGGEPSMLVRGQRSISGETKPLIVVDGIIFLGNINDINPNDIASFDVLKDATSAAAYGSRSANGVIIITTKKGKQGKPVINLNVTGSMQNWHRRPELMGGAQWLDMVRDKNKYTDYSFLSTQQRENYEAGKEIDWLDEATHTGWMQDYQASIGGAGEKMNYYLSTSYTDNDGIVKGDQFSRMTVLGKINTDITNWLQIGVDAAYTHSDYSGEGANFNRATLLTPYDMKYRGGSNSLLEKYPTGQNEFVNPLWGVDSDELDDKDIRNNFRINAYATIKMPWIKGLSYRLNYSGNFDYKNTGQFFHESYYAPLGPYNDENRYSVATQQNYLATANGFNQNEKTNSWIIDNILNYKNVFGKHSIDLTAVATRDSWSRKTEKMSGTDFSSNGNTALGISGLHYAKIQKNDFKNIKKRNVGYFARASYSFNNAYYLTASYRRDGASVFGTDSKWGDFFAFGGAWRITNEPFMKNIHFLDDMKLKFSWGKNGNQGIDPYGTLSTVKAGSSGQVIYPFGNTSLPSYGIKQDALGNSFLGWETTNAWNMGFESIWLNNRLFVDLDVYFSRTTDQLFTRTIPVMSGFQTMKSSMGEVSNKGVEFTVRTVNMQTKDLMWSTGLTFWLNRNKLTHLYGDDLNNDGKEDDDIGNKLFIGHSINSIYGYKQNGIVQKEDVEYMKANGVEAGTPKYVDLNGDGVITIEDRSIIGCKDPNFKLNLSNTVSWKNWELYVMLTGTFGGNGYYQNSNKPAFMAGGAGGGFASNNLYVPYWTENNPSNKYPAAWYLGDDYFMGLQNRAYVRLQDITLSYTFNQPAIRDFGIKTMRVFFTAKNLATITGWKGGDPELGNTINSGDPDSGISGLWPVATTLSIGANISF